MINSINMITVYVRDQELALKFYTEQLGFEKRMDFSMAPGMRWLTVGPKGGQGPELILYDPRGWHKPEVAEEMLKQVGKGPGLVLGTDDCRATVAELEARGVMILQQPTERPYGIEAVFADLYGHGLVLVERRG